jgi:putative Mg2+ transporter-C (MgtC) family protein
VPDIGWLDVLARLALAGALGGAIGLERELRDREAGFRTHLLVAVGAALFTLAGAYGFQEFNYGRATGFTLDPSRIAAQVVTGIGFLGAGAIIRQGFSVKGLTTAATLWIAAAVGLAAGAGFYSGAVIATGVVLFALYPLRVFSRRVVDVVRPDEGRLSIQLGSGGSAAPLFTVLEDHRVMIRSLEMEDEPDGSRLVAIEARLPSAGETAVLLDDVKALEEVRRVEWQP